MATRAFPFANGQLDGQIIDVELDAFGEPYVNYDAGDEHYELRNGIFTLIP